MTIYFITNGINRMGGTERVIVQLAQSLKNVVIIVPGTTDCAFAGYENLNIQSAGIGDFPEDGKSLKIFHRLRYYKKLKNIIKGEQSTTISFSFDLNLLNIYLSKRLMCRPIVCEHIEYGYHNGLRNIIRKKMYQHKGVTLVCLTETDKKKFDKDGIHTYVIPNFIYAQHCSYEVKSKKILSIGRLEYQKNFSFMIEAFAISELYKDGWTLDIVGEGSEKAILEGKIKSLNMDSYIRIHPFTKNIGKFYHAAGLMCMTSRFEAFPMVLLEAMNCSLPVLVSDFPTGAKEILGEYSPQIVQEYDSILFADSLKKVCSSIDLRNKFSFENSKLIEKYYPEKVMSSWIELLNKKENGI